MTTYEPATPPSASIQPPLCSKCGEATVLSAIENQRPGYDLLSFECPTCGHIETRVGKAGRDR